MITLITTGSKKINNKKVEIFYANYFAMGVKIPKKY